MGPVSRRELRPRALRPIRIPERRQARRHLDLAQPEGLAAARELIAQAHVLVENFAPGTLEGWGLGPDGLQPAQPKPGAAAHLCVRPVRTLARPAGHAADPAGGVGVDQRPGSGPPAGAGRRPDRRVRRGCLRRAGRADRAAAAARRRCQGGRCLAVRVAAVDAAVPDADGAADARLGLPANRGRRRCWVSSGPPTAGWESTA